MKFWKKIYIFSLILFVFTFNISGILIIEKNHNEVLKREVNRCLNEHLSIYSGIQLSIPAYDTLKKYSRNINSYNEILSKYAYNYFKNSNDKESYIEILDSGKNIVFSNIDFKLPENREEIKITDEENIQYIIRDISSKTYMFIANNINIDNKIYTFTYVRNISEVYDEKEEQYNFFFKIDLIVSLIFMIFMYFISKYITKPIINITDATKRIAKGAFSEKIEINSKDEIGTLAKNFNLMTEVVNEKINELKRNNAEKQRFINDLTHELKTPLTSIIGYANLLRTTKYNEKIFIDGLNYIYKEGKRLEDLSFKLMNLILLKKEEFKMESKDIKDILFEVKGALIPKLKNKEIQLNIYGSGFKFRMESDLIKVLLSNIIDNAIKASDNNSKVDVNINHNKYEVEIRDYGIGISKEHIDKIFEPFYMVDKARSRANNGAGLGLSICKKILDIHNGRFKVESKLNEGTSITLTFTDIVEQGGDFDDKLES